MFFFHRDRQSPARPFFLGFICVGVAASFFIILAYLTLIAPRRAVPVSGMQPRPPLPAPPSAAAVVQSYRDALQAEETRVAAATDGAALLSDVEQVLFSLHVPKELLEEHFHAVQVVRQLRDGKSPRALSAIQTEVGETLRLLGSHAAALTR